MEYLPTLTRRRHKSALLALLATLLLGMALLSAGNAAAHRGHAHPHPYWDPTPAPSDQALALQWFDVSKDTVAAAGFPEPITSTRTWAVSWLAAARAAEDGFGWRFQDAAFAQALHDTLVAQVPSRQAQLDAALASTLAGIPDGWQKNFGIAAGQHEASKALAERAGDGLDTASVDIPYTPPPPGPGTWQPTPPTFGPAVRAGQKDGRAFLLASNSQFRPGPPPALDSPKFLNALAEIRAVGQDTSSTRTPAQTDTALFIAQDSYALYSQALRAVLADTHHSLLWDARAVAAFHVVEVDTQIAIFEAKYVYTFWRPVTAIRTGSVDPDPTWTPLLATPRHPEYPSGHAGYAGAAEGVLSALTGPWAPQPVAATSTTAPGSVHTYTRWSQITQETIDGRVWEGVHYRFSDETAAKVGKQVAAWDLARLWKLGL
ncbi:MAG TPA: vanadium-dependent haloperoxidase [Solirubrobacterales bacterium]|nr:vanadium-dependent haloperoxidase [Solirubrobacterales bacterium]